MGLLSKAKVATAENELKQSLKKAAKDTALAFMLVAAVNSYSDKTNEIHIGEHSVKMPAITAQVYRGLNRTEGYIREGMKNVFDAVAEISQDSQFAPEKRPGLDAGERNPSLSTLAIVSMAARGDDLGDSQYKANMEEYQKKSAEYFYLHASYPNAVKNFRGAAAEGIVHLGGRSTDLVQYEGSAIGNGPQMYLYNVPLANAHLLVETEKDGSKRLTQWSDKEWKDGTIEKYIRDKHSTLYVYADKYGVKEMDVQGKVVDFGMMSLGKASEILEESRGIAGAFLQKVISNKKSLEQTNAENSERPVIVEAERLAEQSRGSKGR